MSNKKLTDYILKIKQNQERVAFENSHDNVLRSIATYYTAGVMGKRKYQAMRIASTLKRSNAKQGGKTAIKFMSNCPIPKLVTYHALSKEN